MSVQTMFSSVGKALKANAPYILTGIGSAGVITVAFSAARDTLKAKDLVYEARQNGVAPETKTDYIRLCWKAYIPTYVTATGAIACIIGASMLQHKQAAALASLYSISETALKEYKDQVKEIGGKTVAEKVDMAVAEKKVKDNPPSDSTVIVTGNGEQLCYDAFSGRYFKSDPEKLRRIQNMVNSDLLRSDFLSLNDIYEAIGLPDNAAGELVGWRSDQGLIEFEFTTVLTPDEVPCLCINFAPVPNEAYYELA